MTILQHPSPNQGPRRDGARPDMVVIHYTAMDSAAAALERLCDPTAEVSAHYLICPQGRVWQMVDEAQRAWHAGAGRWGAVTDVNSRSIGIELANRGDHPFAAAQMDALEGVLAQVMARWAIPPERVIGHSDMAPLRKSDPGPRFDWRRLARRGLSVWPDIQDAPPASDFLTDAAGAGFHSPEGCADPVQAVLTAVRLRFRPCARGPLDEWDRAIVADLAHRFPVDRAPATA
ncbi:MAG: N-acetylmuramoyl-L-alanine amidase [Rhodobacterales bacterium]|nr:N-acetylmuramoyl-L-alanine amidase [Rhodobacterales bacterium]MDX5411973.1 N-acetylmuramoyl-L-alanine amidase [Rhodobacterales bacterium]